MECRYYKRVTRLRATICWGVILLSACELAAAAQGRRPAIVRPASSKQPAVRPYALASSIDLDVPGPVSLLAGGTHLVLVGGRGPVRGFALDDLHQTWSDESEIVPSPTAPPVTANGLVFVTTDESIRAIDERTGTLRWRAPADGRIGPIATSGWLLVASGEGIRAYRADDGSPVWQRELGSAVVAEMAFEGSHLFAVLAGRLLASLDLTSGRLDWVKNLPVEAGDLLAANSRVYFGAADGNFYCYSQDRDPDPKWMYPTRVGAIGPPVTDGARVIFAAYDNTVRALDARSGNMEWSTPLVSRPAGSLFVEKGHVVVALTSGDLELLLSEHGESAGRLAPARPPGQEGMQLESIAATDRQQLFRITALPGGSRRLDTYRPAELAVSPVSSPPGRPLELRAPPVKRPAHP